MQLCSTSFTCFLFVAVSSSAIATGERLVSTHNRVSQTQPETPNKVYYTDASAKRTIDRLYKKLKAGQPFGVLARQYSQDDGSFSMGGDLGWQKSNQFVPDFERIVSQLSINQVSKPFKTGFGYHIVQLLGRREGEVLSRHILLRVQRKRSSLQ